jgi:hypothetical protein
MLIVDNFRGKNLVLSKCQGTRVDGDNPLVHFYPLFNRTQFTTFYHRFLYGYSVKTTFFPLTTPTGPVFYYVYFLAKKGIVSEERGETNVVSVIGVFYPPSTREPIHYLTPNEVDIIVPFIVETCSMWEKVVEI